MTKGRSIRLFLVDGLPGGIITAEIMNWTGHVMVAPRSRIADLVQRDEAKRTGVYFLTGIQDGAPAVYIGETDDVGRRLSEHSRDPKMEFWQDLVCVVTSKDQNLTKAHVRFLETSLIKLAGDVGRVKLVNGTEGSRSARLPESDTADMEFFLEQLTIVMPVLGLEFLRQAGRNPPPADAGASGCAEAADPASPVFVLTNRTNDFMAEAREIDGVFVVLADSTARGKGLNSWNSYSDLREALIKVKTLQLDGKVFRFARNTEFKSPSAASSVILDRNDNGRLSWKMKSDPKKTYADWQEEKLAAVADRGGEE